MDHFRKLSGEMFSTPIKGLTVGKYQDDTGSLGKNRVFDSQEFPRRDYSSYFINSEFKLLDTPKRGGEFLSPQRKKAENEQVYKSPSSLRKNAEDPNINTSEIKQLKNTKSEIMSNYDTLLQSHEEKCKQISEYKHKLEQYESDHKRDKSPHREQGLSQSQDYKRELSEIKQVLDKKNKEISDLNKKIKQLSIADIAIPDPTMYRELELKTNSQDLYRLNSENTRLKSIIKSQTDKIKDLELSASQPKPSGLKFFNSDPKRQNFRMYEDLIFKNQSLEGEKAKLIKEVEAMKKVIGLESENDKYRAVRECFRKIKCQNEERQSQMEYEAMISRVREELGRKCQENEIFQFKIKSLSDDSEKNSSKIIECDAKIRYLYEIIEIYQEKCITIQDYLLNVSKQSEKLTFNPQQKERLISNLNELVKNIKSLHYDINKSKNIESECEKLSYSMLQFKNKEQIYLEMLDKLKCENSSMQVIIESEKNKAIKADDENKELFNKFLEQQTRINVYEQALKVTESKADVIEKNFNNKCDMIEVLETNNNKLKDDLKSEISQQAEIIERYQNEMSTMQNTLSAYQFSNKAANEEIIKLKARIDSDQNAIRSLKQIVGMLESTQNDKRFKEEIDRLKSSNIAGQTEIKELIKQRTQDKVNQDKELFELNQKISICESIIQANQVKIEASDTVIEELKNKLSEIVGKYTRNHEELDLLRAENKEYSKMADSLKQRIDELEFLNQDGDKLISEKNYKIQELQKSLNQFIKNESKSSIDEEELEDEIIGGENLDLDKETIQKINDVEKIKKIETQQFQKFLQNSLDEDNIDLDRLRLRVERIMMRIEESFKESEDTFLQNTGFSIQSEQINKELIEIIKELKRIAYDYKISTSYAITKNQENLVFNENESFLRENIKILSDENQGLQIFIRELQQKCQTLEENIIRISEENEILLEENMQRN